MDIATRWHLKAFILGIPCLRCPIGCKQLTEYSAVKISLGYIKLLNILRVSHPLCREICRILFVPVRNTAKRTINPQKLAFWPCHVAAVEGCSFFTFSRKHSNDICGRHAQYMFKKVPKITASSPEPSCYKIALEKCFIPVLQLKFVGTHLANVKTELLSWELLPSTFSDWLYKIIASFITLQEKKKPKNKTAKKLWTLLFCSNLYDNK